jgi:hypothetical protein
LLPIYDIFASGADEERRRNGATYLLKEDLLKEDLLKEDLLKEERYEDNESRSGICVYIHVAVARRVSHL